uniref:Uncharacterized protein n=1 Tax=Phenylobacterium glaciei TaxID=2803784 RepID=A0A974P4I5_9CAUL|nr:hypothetical protein JKL49_06375 [Phenylobacterium glaciei]
MQAYPMEDIFYQASTRGGREIDKILAGKAQFKATTGGIGSFLSDTTVALSSNNAAFSANGQYGDAVAAVGVLSGVFLIVSSNSKPQADVRTWSSLPDTVHVLTLGSGGKTRTSPPTSSRPASRLRARTSPSPAPPTPTANSCASCAPTRRSSDDHASQNPDPRRRHGLPRLGRLRNHTARGRRPHRPAEQHSA